MPRTPYLFAKMLFIGSLAFACSDDGGDGGGGGNGGAAADPVSFAADIHPIFLAKCAECHNVDLMGPFPGHALPDADDAYAATIQDGVEDQKVYERILVRTDPPPGAGFEIMPPGCGTGLDDGNCLTTAEHELIEEWIRQGTPR